MGFHPRGTRYKGLMGPLFAQNENSRYFVRGPISMRKEVKRRNFCEKNSDLEGIREFVVLHWSDSEREEGEKEQTAEIKTSSYIIFNVQKMGKRLSILRP